MVTITSKKIYDSTSGYLQVDNSALTYRLINAVKDLKQELDELWNKEDGTYSAALGWDSINTQGKRWIEKYYANGRNIIHPVVKKEKPLVKFFNNTAAYLIWKQYNADKDMKMYQVSQETRLLEKQADGWKIVNVTALWNSKEKIPVDSLRISR